MKIGLQSIVKASREQLASAVGGETVILGLRKGHYYGVDAVAARVWELVQHPLEVASICSTIVAEYAVDADTCRRDVLRLLGEMQEAGLLEVSDPHP